MDYKKGKEMKYAIIEFDGRPIARAEKIFFPNVKSNCKQVTINDRVKIYEDD